MKTKIYISWIICSLIVLPLSAQQAVDDILSQIEENNLLLNAVRKETEAEKIGNKTGIYLENPEVEYEYLWGVDSDESDQKFSVVQSFDFPTVYYHKKKVSDEQNKQVDLRFLIQRKDILLEARKLCIELAYQRDLKVDLKRQLDNMQDVYDMYYKLFEKGELNVISLNKSKIDLANISRRYTEVTTEIKFLTEELTRLNGGQAIDISGLNHLRSTPPASFEEWYAGIKAKNLSLQLIQQEINLSRKSEKLQRSSNLPKLSAGYAAEKGALEHFRGVVVGVSIPLFENKNTVKQIKAQTQSHLAFEANEEMRFYNESKALYNKSLSLYRSLNEYILAMPDVHALDHLQKAHEYGEISRIDFLQELGAFFDIFIDLNELWRDLNLLVADMNQWEL